MRINNNVILTFKFVLAIFFVFLFLFSFNKMLYAREEVKFLNELNQGLREPVDVAISKKGDIYVLDKNESKVFIYSDNGSYKLSFCKKGTEVGELDNPKSIAINKRGEILVADTGNSRVQVFNKDGEFLYQIGNFGYSPGQFISPDNVAIDQLGYIYVSDSSTKKVSKFTPNGVFLEAKKLNNKPRDLVFDLHNNMYLLMPETGSIVKTSSGTEDTRQIYLDYDGINFLSRAEGISVDSRGDIYIIENNLSSIKKIDQHSNILLSFGSKGSGRGQFNKPLGIVSDPTGKLYIADSNNKRVQVLEVLGSDKPEMEKVDTEEVLVDFEKSIAAQKSIVDLNYVSGKGLYALSDYYSDILVKKPDSLVFERFDDYEKLLNDPKALYVFDQGDMVVADSGSNRLHFLDSKASLKYNFGRKGYNNGEFNDLEGVTASKNGYVYVADTKNNRIQIFNNDGIFINSFGEKSGEITQDDLQWGRFDHPKDLVFNSRDELYVLDYNNKRIQVFDDEGNFIKSIGDMTDSNVKFEDPVDISIDEKDYIYVADRGSHRIKILNPECELITEFGSQGKGHSYFPYLTSLVSAEGKIYVADLKVDEIKVFSFNKISNGNEEKLQFAKNMEEDKSFEEMEDVEATQETEEIEEAEKIEETQASEEVQKAEEVKKEKIFLTKVFCPSTKDLSKVNYDLGRKAILSLVRDEFASMLGVSSETLIGFINIESEEKLPNGQLKLTASVEKNINSITNGF